MRFAISLVVLVIALPAHAERGSGASFDVGYARSRVAVSDETALSGEVGRFGLRVSVARHFHFGGEVEEGSIEGRSSLPDGAVARSRGETGGPLDGNTLALKAYAGVHTTAGALMFGADLATGMRDTSVSSALGMDVAGRKNELLLEVRSRADVWLTSTLTLGAVASTDVLERRNVSLGAVLALQFTR